MRAMAVVLLLSLPLAGCFSYLPAESTPQRASRVRVILSSPADFRLTQYTANEVVLVDAEMIGVEGETLVVSARQLQARSGYEFLGQGETLRIPRSNVASLERRKLSPARTAAVGAALVAAMTVTGRLIGIGGGGDSGGRGGTPGET